MFVGTLYADQNARGVLRSFSVWGSIPKMPRPQNFGWFGSSIHFIHKPNSSIQLFKTRQMMSVLSTCKQSLLFPLEHYHCTTPSLPPITTLFFSGGDKGSSSGCSPTILQVWLLISMGWTPITSSNVKVISSPLRIHVSTPSDVVWLYH